jgi:hypothetical protein
MPGDESGHGAQMTVTRARDIAAAPQLVWPWLVQIGEGRGGFYSYDKLERLIGMKTRSAKTILPEHQSLSVGDRISLGPWNAAFVTVTDLREPEVLAVRLGDGPSRLFDWSWSFLVVARPGGCRLLIRARYRWEKGWLAPAVRGLDLGDALMTRRMLEGISQRAERGG